MSPQEATRHIAITILGADRVEDIETEGLEFIPMDEPTFMPKTVGGPKRHALVACGVGITVATLEPMTEADKARERERLNAEVRRLRDVLNDAYWKFTRQARGVPPSIAKPEETEQHRQALLALRRLRRVPTKEIQP